MIDLADPTTDVEQLYKEFRDYHNKHLYTNSNNKFSRYDVYNWCPGLSKEVYHWPSKGKNDSLELLISIWHKAGFIKKNKSSIYWFCK